MTEKGELIVGEIDMGQGPISLVPFDAEPIHIHGSPVDIRIAPIPKSRVDIGTIHVHASMLTGV